LWVWLGLMKSVAGLNTIQIIHLENCNLSGCGYSKGERSWKLPKVFIKINNNLKKSFFFLPSQIASPISKTISFNLVNKI
jgi:hypothetical protein